MNYSWYDEYYRQILKNIGRIAEPHVKAGVVFDGWLAWFKQAHSDTYKKFSALEKKMDDSWDQLGDQAMSAFRDLCRQYEDTHRWVIGEFVKQQVAV